MSSAVLTPGGLEVSSNSEAASDMLATLTPKDEKREARILTDKGKTVATPEAPSDLSKAAAEMGKEGAKAAAAKREEAAQEAEKAKAVEAKAAERKGNPRHDPEARIAEIAREKNEAREALKAQEARAQKAEQRLAELERRETARPEATIKESLTVAKPSDDDPEPKDSDPKYSDNYSDYVKDVGRWAARQERKDLDRKASERSEAESFARNVAETAKRFVEKVSHLKQGEDFDPEHARLLVPSPELPHGTRPGPHNAMADEILTSDHPAEFLTYFKTNPDEFQRLAALRSPRDITREMAKLERDFERTSGAATADTSTEREPSKAKGPIRSVIGTPPAAEPDLFSDQSFDTFMKRKAAARR